jgi:FAD binding domain-containing protein
VVCVKFARRNEIAIAIRAGGHSFAGDSFSDGGIVIDLSAMKSNSGRAERHLARADAGLIVGEFDRATESFGLAAVLGECSLVGIAGFTLGGGLGRLMGKHGAACDNLVSAELVTADGRVLETSSEENADLFWGIRGAGANFGIVTSLEYQLHPVGQIFGRRFELPNCRYSRGAEILDDYMTDVPDEMNLVIDIGNKGIMTFAPGILEPIVSLAVSYCGNLAAGEIVLKPLRSFRRPFADTIRAMPYVQIQSLSGIGPFTCATCLRVKPNS